MNKTDDVHPETVTLPPLASVCCYCGAEIVPPSVAGAKEKWDGTPWTCSHCRSNLSTSEALLLRSFVHAVAVGWQPRLAERVEDLRDRHWRRLTESLTTHGIDQSPIVLTTEWQHGWLTGVLVPRAGEEAFMFQTIGDHSDAPDSCLLLLLPIEGLAVEKVQTLRHEFAEDGDG